MFCVDGSFVAQKSWASGAFARQQRSEGSALCLKRSGCMPYNGFSPASFFAAMVGGSPRAPLEREQTPLKKGPARQGARRASAIARNLSPIGRHNVAQGETGVV